MSNIIVTTTVNKVTWQVDKTAYGKALKQVKSLKKEWESVGSSVGKRNNPAEKLVSAAAQAKLVTKRLAQTERAEAAKSTAHAIALAKKEANARAAINKRESARRKQAVSSLTSNRTPEGQQEYNKLRDHFARLQKENGADRTNGLPKPARTMNSPAGYKPSGISHFGKPGQEIDAEGKTAAAQVAAMDRYHKQMNAVEDKAAQKASQTRAKENAKRKADQAKGDAADEKAWRRREVVIGNAQRRLEAQLGPGWRKKTKGFESLSDSLKLNAGDISQYNSQVGQMIRNAKAAAGQTATLGESVKSLRRSLIGVTAAYSAFNAGASVLSNGQFFESMNATMLMVSDTSQEAGKKMQFVQKESYRLGLSLKVASQGYTQMAINAKGVISDSDTDNLFKGLSEFATASGADPVKYQRGITAISQMLGKGQVTAEELKQQLAEALPGSMQVFVNAAKKYFKDDKIGVPEFLELMKNGKILAKDILPEVAKGFAEMARKNGALNAQLKSSRVAQERLRQSWAVFQNEVFKGGFGESMTKLFNSLADILKNGGPVGKALGEFASGFIDSMTLIVDVTYDTFLIINALFKKFMDDLGIKNVEMSKIWNWAGMAIGALMFVGALRSVFGILTKIAGLRGAITAIGEALGTVDGSGKEGKPDKGKKGRGIGGRKILAGLGILGVGAALDLGFENSQQPDFMEKVQANNNKPTLGTDIANWWASLKAGHNNDRLNYLQSNSIMPKGAGGQSSSAAAPEVQKVEGQIKITLDAGEMQKLFDQKIEDANMGNINLIAGVPMY